MGRGVMQGVILADGSGVRIYSIAKGIGRQLLPVYDKPIIYYPLPTIYFNGSWDKLYQQHKTCQNLNYIMSLLAVIFLVLSYLKSF